MSLLAICPSRGRPAAARELLASFMATRKDEASRLVFVVDSDDDTQNDYPEGHVWLATPGGSYMPAINAAVKDPDVIRDATAVGFVGDDNRFRTDGWDLILGGWLAENIGIAYGDDGFQHEKLPTCWFLSRPIVDAFGLGPRGLHHYFTDNYWRDLGQDAGCLRYFPDVSIEHLHPLAGKAEQDAIYDRSHQHARADRLWYGQWSRRGRKADADRLRTITRSRDKRRVFADWHHPALWESLSILFEDRFGWELYSPIGPEWLKRAWRFSCCGWQPEDYLTFPDAQMVGSHYERSDPEFPERPRKMVTTAQADAMQWDFVLGSVTAHQRPFAELARNWKARFIHQVGNARQPIDRSVRQLILASAAIPRGTRDAVIYHQEFDRSLFSYTPVTNPAAVTSFMLRLDDYSGPYQWLSEASGVTWKSVGDVDRRTDAYLAPMTKVAEAMRQTGWVWHDKTIGDGFGHVVHNAAAMGRPLIGHASNYKGRVAEPFWTDLVTAIDLDRHTPEVALRLIRAISADPEWHTAMAEELAATFTRLVDFDSEAAAIRRLLD